ncbi:transposable element Hobo transposase [Parasteatoda tepidariorum]|uniref:transposable element Hobo transposase n=1 Tax=Parasteatoda tepidariorum TaxID=114398 RepID=UPI001C71F204|nr:zinc finger protein 618 [Parasteatoda tepidariorum]
MENSSATLVCSSDVAAFVDALETLNCNETVSTYGENIVICIADQDGSIVPTHAPVQETDTAVTDIEDACADSGGQFFNPVTRKLKAVMQQLVAQNKATIIKKSSVHNSKGNKQFKSDVWNWFGDVRLFITENDAERLKIPYYIRLNGSEQQMICKVFVGCFRCSAIFMYDSQHHSTSTLRYHIRACTRLKECIFISDDKMDDENQLIPGNKTLIVSQDGITTKVKRFRTDPRKQKEVIEQLFQKQKAIITKKSFMNMKGNRRFKSDVWNWFGDIRLLISRSEAKKLKIPYYIRRCGDEQMVLSKVFVGCFKCLALFIHDSQKSTSTLRYHVRTCSRPKERKKRTVPNIIFFPSNKKSIKLPSATVNESDVIPAHEKLLNCALSTESSLSMIHEPEFLKILEMCINIGQTYGDVNIGSLLCATPTLTSFILNDLYVSSVNEFYTEFQHSYGATYRLSVWIDEQVKFPFVSVYCSYVNLAGELKNVIIHTDDFDYETKTPDSVRAWLNLFLADQPVVPFKRLIAIDNESNLVPVFKEETCVKCCIQNLTKILQQTSSKGFAITDSELPDFTNLLSSCVDLVNYFQQISDQYELPEELTKCPDSKWTSLLSLFRSIEEQYDFILSVLNETNSTHLLSVEKSTITSIVKFFNIFEEALLQLSNQNKPTLNLVVPWISKLQKHCSVDIHDLSVLKQLKSNMLLEMAEVTSNMVVEHHIAAMLDPRFKSMTFGFSAQYKEAHTKLRNLIKESMVSPNVEDFVDVRKSYLSSGKIYDPSKCEKAATQELDKYISEPFQLLGSEEENQFEVLKYWKTHSELYPDLSKIAQWILSCPASCVEDNEVFWSNNWQVHCPRLPLPPDNVNKVLFVKSFRGL